MTVKCESFRELRKNTLIGFADLIIEPIGIRLHGCGLMKQNGSAWISLPSRSYEDGKGEKKYARLVDFSTRNNYYLFQDAAIKAISEFRKARGDAA